MMTLANERTEYGQGSLNESTVAAEPLAQFRDWYQQALTAAVPEPNAMTLATAADGLPSARIVLLKGVDDRGFLFFTDYRSQKGSELERNPQAALVFFWQPLERQVRVVGSVERVSRSESEAYFESRPEGSKLGAWTSWQSRVIADRTVLERSLAEVTARFQGQPVPCPPEWGGYRVIPDAVEFWQGRENRLHDRVRFRRDAGRWHRDRLSP
jgi:pyridoxamine 5'-phosphate oxidase